MRRTPAKQYTGDDLMNYAVRLLSGRAMTVAEVRKKLDARATDPTEVPGIITRLTEARLLSDERFAESFTAARRDLRLFGQQRVQRELAQRQVPKAVAETAIRSAYEEVDEASLALEFLQRKIRVPDPAKYFQDPKHLQSAFRKLRYAGFSGTASIKALRNYSTYAEELEELPEDEE